MLTLLLACSGSDKDAQPHDSSPTVDTPTVTTCAGSASPYTSWEDPVAAALRCGIDGVEVTEGRFDYFTMEECAELIAQGESCDGNHPASPYAQVRFDDDDDGLLIPSYQLDQDEALLYVGRTPPPSRYWGMSHYQYWKALDEADLKLYPNLESPFQTFGTHARSLHLLNAVTTPSETTPFGDWFAVLFTANETTASEVAARLGPVLSAHGHDPSVLNVVEIALADDADYAALLEDPAYDDEELFQITMGYGPDADRHTIVIRIADPEDQADPYLDPATIPAAAFRVRLTDRPAYDPFPFPHLPPEDETGETQGDDLRAARDRVVAEIQRVNELLGHQVEVAAFDNLPQKTSADCVEMRIVCGGNNDDARYLRSRRYSIPSLSNDQSAVYVVGVIHDLAGQQISTAPKVSYSSLTLLNYTNGAGLISLLDRDLEGSIRDFFPLGVPGVTPEQEALLYVKKYTRHCHQPVPSCIELPADDPVTGVAPFDLFWFTERAYLNRTSLTAPHETSVIEPAEVAVSPVIERIDLGTPSSVHTRLTQ